LKQRRAVLAAAAGPLLIVAATLMVLHDFALLGKMSTQHVDPLAFWLPTHCFLGESLSAGHIPTWNPHVMGGVPFAADPQSGWMYLPAMLLYTALPCGTALRWFMVLQPIVAGLGVYWFLRSEGLSRPAGTVGGLMLALGMASSRLALTLPFAGMLAWTPIMLACASRLYRARAMPARLAWAGLVAAAWGQVAAAHMSHGLILATGALVFYALAKSRAEVRAGCTGRQMLAVAGLLVVALPLVNLAFFLPRLAYLPRTTLALGYERLETLGDRLAGRHLSQAPLGAAVSPPWVLGFATSPGAYLGATALALSFAGWWLRRNRYLVTTITAFAALSYFLSLRIVASAVETGLSWLPLSDLYLHEPARLRYGVLLALPVLAAAGVDAWREAPKHRMRMLLPGLLAWSLLPLVAGVEAARLALPVAGIVAGVAALMAAATRPALVALFPAILAVELSVNGLIGQTYASGYVPTRLEPPLVNVPFTPLAQPRFEMHDYLERSPIARLQSEDDRFISLDPTLVTTRGYLEHQGPASWGLLANQRAMLFGLEDAQGYNPVQLLPYWKYVRAVEAKEIKYNAAFFVHPSNQALDLLDVAWIVGSASDPPVPEATAVAQDGLWALYHVETQSPRASVLTQWTVVRAPEAALAAVTTSEFQPTVQVVLENEPGFPQRREVEPTPAQYARLSSGSARVVVDAPSAAVVLVRNSYDPNWRARLDGQPVPVFRADSFLQAVLVPSGRHVIDLEYHDPWVIRGLWGSGVAIGGLVIAGIVLRRRQRRVAPSPGYDEEDSPDPGGKPGHHPGELGRERAAEHGEYEQAGGDVHGQRESRDDAHGRRDVSHPEPRSRKEPGHE
jgi:hypothetical protein